MSTLRSTEWDLLNGLPLGNGSGRRFSAFDLELFSKSALSPSHSSSPKHTWKTALPFHEKADVTGIEHLKGPMEGVQETWT